MRTIHLALCAAIMMGCAGGGLPTAPSLNDPVMVTVAGESPMNRISFTVRGNAAGTQMSLPVEQPRLTLETTDRGAKILAVSLPVPDVDVPPKDIPPDGLRLRRISLSGARATAHVVSASTDALELSAQLPLVVSWSLLLNDGSLYKLGDLQTEPVDLDVRVVRNQGQALATLQARCNGVCWTIDGVAQLSDALLFVQADADITPAN